MTHYVLTHPNAGEHVTDAENPRARAGDVKDIYAEAKSAGFDSKVIRQIIALRKKEPAEVEEQRTLLGLYGRALGMDLL